MKFRKLRIAWSVACGILCLLLIVLWVRSYWSSDLYLYWFAIFMIAALAAVPWFEWSPRFSIRTLLFGTTLVAVMMWIAVYAARK
jgi:hypothetical protein